MENLRVKAANSVFIIMEILGLNCRPLDRNLSKNCKYLMISNSAMYITEDFTDNLGKEEILSSKEALESSEIICGKIEFSSFDKISFGSLEKFLKAEKFPIKIKTKNSRVYFFELKKEDYLYLRKIFCVVPSRGSSGNTKNPIFSQSLRDRLFHLESSRFINKLFEVVVIDQNLMDEEQFQRVVFDSRELHVLVEQKKIERKKGFGYLAHKVHERTKRGNFQIDYVVPDLWKNHSKLVVVNEDEHDLLHSVGIPQIDKVKLDGMGKS